ncbi:MAG: aldo/keto reductase [Candidatus Latescibacteria bacterium]|nr:aldo/keto reductase [Candidatus Latescibacterota bacterium]
MNLRPLPHTDLLVSPLCLGTMTFGAPVGRAQAVALVHRALDLGVNFIDTANIYEGYRRVPGSAGGVAEEILGEALAGRRAGVVLATKAGNAVGPGPEDRGLGAAHLRRECRRSLERLRTDYLDLFYLHRPDGDTPLEESVAAVADLIAAGHVRHWGLSNFSAIQTSQVLEVCREGGWPLPVVHQPAYSLLNRQADADLLPLCRREALAVAPYRVLEGGLLTGKYQSGVPGGSRGADKPDWIPHLQEAATLARLRALEAEAQTTGLALFDYTLQTTAAIPGITSLVLGMTSIPQLEAAAHALERS